MVSLDFNIESLSSKDINDLWIFLNNRATSATAGKTLYELFDNQQRFLAIYNEWSRLKKQLVLHNENEYISYMKNLETTNPNIDTALDISGVNFDNTCTSTEEFVKIQMEHYKDEFPFKKDEVVAWDKNHFILRDTVYYSITGKHAVFFLKRLDCERN